MSPSCAAAGPSRPRPPHNSSRHAPFELSSSSSSSLPRARSGPSIPTISSSSPPEVSYISTTTATTSHTRPSPGLAEAVGRRGIVSGRDAVRSDMHPGNTLRRHQSASDDILPDRRHADIPTRKGTTSHRSQRMYSVDETPRLRRVKSLTGNHPDVASMSADAPPVPAIPNPGGTPRKEKHGSSQSWGGSLVSGAYTAGVYGAALGLTAYRLWSGGNARPKTGSTTGTSIIHSATKAPNTNSARAALIQHNGPNDLPPPPAYEEVQARHTTATSMPGRKADHHTTPAKSLERGLKVESSAQGQSGREGREEADRRTSPAVNALKAVVSADSGQPSLDHWSDARPAGVVGGRGSKGAGRRYASDGVLSRYEGDVFDDDLSPHIHSPYSPHSPRTPTHSSFHTASTSAKRSLHQHPLLHNTPGRQFGRVYKKRFGTFESMTSAASVAARGGVRGGGDSLSGSASGSGSGSGSAGRTHRRRKGLQGVFDTPGIPSASMDTYPPSSGQTEERTEVERDDPSHSQAQYTNREDERILEQLDEMGYRIQRLIMEGQNALAARPEDLVSPLKRRAGANGVRGRGRGRGAGRRGAASAWRDPTSGDRRAGSGTRRYRSEDQNMLVEDEFDNEDEDDYDHDEHDEFSDEYDERLKGPNDGVCAGRSRQKPRGDDRDRLKARRSLPVVGLTR